MESDAKLAGASMAGDRDAFGAIVDRYKTLVCSITYSRTGDLSLSEELAQETFLIAWRKLETLGNLGKLRAWLCGIARNVTRTRVRRERREPAAGAATLDRVAEVFATEPTPAERAISREELDVLWSALERIPETYREPMVLFYREGQSVRAVAELLDLSEVAVKQRLSRGREKLRLEMTAFVEDALCRSMPSEKFTAAVVGALTLTGAKQAAAMTMAASVDAGMGALSLGNILGVITGIAGGLYGAWNDYRRAQSSKERRIVVISTAAVFIYIVIFLLTFLLLDRLAGLRTPGNLRLLMAWLGAGIGGFGALIGILMSRLNRARCEAQGIDLNALRARPLLVEEYWRVSPFALSLRRAILATAIGLSALAISTYVWIAIEYSFFEPGAPTAIMAIAATILASGIIAALWLWTSPKLTAKGRRHNGVWMLVLATIIAAYLAAAILLPDGVWKKALEDSYWILMSVWLFHGLWQNHKLEKSGLLYVQAEMPKSISGVKSRVSRGTALLQVYGIFIGAVFWMLVMAAMVGDWVVVFAVAAAIAIVPLATLRTFTPWYWRIVLGDMVGAAALTLTVVNLRWNPWMALYRDSRFYERVNDQPLWVMDLMLGALFAFFIGAILFKIRRESTGEQNHE